MVASNRTDPILGTVNIPHLGEEVYDNIWQKVRSIWSYVYDHYYDKYDWFHIGGDDLYVIVENLRQYLESVEIRTAANGGINLPNGSETSQVPLYLGRRFAYSKARIYNTGGPGYTLNRAALKTLVALGMPKFFTHNRTSVEDVMVAKILGKFKVFPYDTKDRFGGERYMHFSPGRHYEMQMGREIPDWYPAFSGRTKDQSDYCSARSVSFHYLNTERMRRLHARLYGYCPAAVASPGEVK
jgi:glycoprotein-N-acetylgalactosamine 3-beta-galactosyltransferase